MTDNWPPKSLNQRWCCFNCNQTMRVGAMKMDFSCPFCGSQDTHPAEGVKELKEYHGPIPKVLS
jgi:predicted RNA-binding Zn-ribbon protein involved in translation (DUF1610 family)